MYSKLKQDWTHFDNTLRLEVECQDFIEAVNLINKIAQISEEENHHPDICLYRYKFIQIDVYSHHSNKLTKKDIVLAKRIEEVL